MFQQVLVDANKIYQIDFLKVIVLQKEECLNPFVEHPAHGLLSLKRKTKSFKPIAVLLYERSNEWLFSERIFSIPAEKGKNWNP